ncbi:MAG: hypothetical protein ACRDA4_08230 [Filifactoraceae bacterium]
MGDIKDNFLEMEPLQAIENINELLLTYKTLSGIERELGISRKSITRRAEKINYIFNKAVNKYEHIDNITIVPDIILADHTPVARKEPRITKVTPGTLSNVDLEGLRFLLDHIEDFRNLILNNSNVDTVKHITVDLPTDLSNFKTTVGLNKVVWERFCKFADTWKQYNKKDLHSQALLEFMDKYNT